MQRHLTASALFFLNDARRRNNHYMCPSNRVDLLLVGGLKRKVQIYNKPNSETIFYYLSVLQDSQPLRGHEKKQREVFYFEI